MHTTLPSSSSLNTLRSDPLTTRTIPHTKIDSDALQHLQLALSTYECHRTTLGKCTSGTLLHGSQQHALIVLIVQVLH
jgi:hypothetical protein